MNIVLWIGNETNQKALANKIHFVFPISGIVIESRKVKTKPSFASFIHKIMERILAGSIGRSWNVMKKYYGDHYPAFPKTSLLDLENINSDEAYDFTKKLAPDLIIVSGTRLIKEKMLSIKPKIGILNLHTGLSPYIKGGPNCTNWCISTGQYHLIGNTIMWIDIGIDTGNILTTELTEFTGNENLSKVHIKVMQHAHELYLKAITYILKGSLKSVPQSTIATGKTYYTKDWNMHHKLNLIRNMPKFRNHIKSSPQSKKIKEQIMVINL